MSVNSAISVDTHGKHGDPRLTPDVVAWAADGPMRNHVLSSLRPRDLAAIRPHLKTGRLREHQVLLDMERPVGHVFFPESSIVSLTSIEANRTLAVGTVGVEGMVGLGVFLGEPVSIVRATVHAPGVARRMRGPTFKRLVRQLAGFREAMMSYTRSFIVDLNRRENCGRAHTVEERCARWLLVTSDRVGDVSFPLALEFLALMVGVRRAGVTAGLRALQDRHLIHYDHGRVDILDRRGLEHATCECYVSLPSNSF